MGKTHHDKKPARNSAHLTSSCNKKPAGQCVPASGVAGGCVDGANVYHERVIPQHGLAAPHVSGQHARQRHGLVQIVHEVLDDLPLDKLCNSRHQKMLHELGGSPEVRIHRLVPSAIDFAPRLPCCGSRLTIGSCTLPNRRKLFPETAHHFSRPAFEDLASIPQNETKQHYSKRRFAPCVLKRSSGSKGRRLRRSNSSGCVLLYTRHVVGQKRFPNLHVSSTVNNYCTTALSSRPSPYLHIHCRHKVNALVRRGNLQYCSDMNEQQTYRPLR